MAWTAEEVPMSTQVRDMPARQADVAELGRKV